MTDSTIFKTTELGDIPAEWEVVRLTEAVALSRKPRNLDLSKFNAIPFIPMELVPDNGTFIKDYEQKAKIGSGTYCEKGDILLAKITPSFENGKQGIVGEIPLDFAYATTEVYPLKAKPTKLDQMFLFHFLKLSRVRVDIAGKMEGTTGRQRVPKSVIENYPIPLPPLAEQRKIAHILNTVQRAIAAQDDLIAAAQALKRSLMRRVFTYGPGIEPAPTRETEIGEAPGHWEQITVGQACKSGGGLVQTGPFGSQLHAADYVSRGIPSVMPKNIGKDGKIDSTDISLISKPDHERLSRYHLRAGDVVYGRRGDIGRRALVLPEQNGWLCGTGCLFVRIGNYPMDPEFLAYYLGYQPVVDWIISRAVGTTMLNLNSKILRSVPLYFPNQNQQQQIACTLRAADAKIAAEQDRKGALQELFNSLLQALMTGRLRV